MHSSEFWRKAKRLIAAEYSLLSHSILLPFRPTQLHLRRVIGAAELLRSRLPLVRLETIIGREFDDGAALELRAIAQHEHNCSILELLALGLIAKMYSPQTAFEIGTYDGRSALAIAGNMPAEAKLFTLNLPPDYTELKEPEALKYDEKLASKVTSGFRWRRHPEIAKRIRQLFGNSMAFDFTQYAPAQMVFIDGGHDEATVTEDSRNAMKLVDRSRGVILWHDATKFGVKPALESFAAEGHPVCLIENTSLGILRFEGGKEASF